MTEHIKELYFDEPIPYKELLIYPVTMKDYLEFHLAVSCLLIDKNSIPDVNIISMSYLRFLYYQSLENKQKYLKDKVKIQCSYNNELFEVFEFTLRGLY